MPDLEDTPIEGEPTTPVEDAQGAPDTETPPWGDDFDPGKAWKTITNQRESEKQLKERLRLLEEDDEAFAELARKRGFEVQTESEDDSEEDLEFEDDDPIAPVKSELDEIKRWKEERESERLANQIREDLTAINADADWELDDYDRQQIVADAARDPKGFDKAALERAHEKYIARLERAAERGVERAKTPKPKAPHVTSAGKAGTQVPDLDNEAERHAYMKERVAALAREQGA